MLHGEKFRELYNSGKYQLDKSSAEFIDDCRAMNMIFSVWVAAMVTRIPDVIRFLWQLYCRGTLRQLCEMYSCGQRFFGKGTRNCTLSIAVYPLIADRKLIKYIYSIYILIVIHMIILNRFCQLYIFVYTQ
jgi:hypothetical protein